MQQEVQKNLNKDPRKVAENLQHDQNNQKTNAIMVKSGKTLFGIDYDATTTSTNLKKNKLILKAKIAEKVEKNQERNKFLLNYSKMVVAESDGCDQPHNHNFLNFRNEMDLDSPIFKIKQEENPQIHNNGQKRLEKW